MTRLSTHDAPRALLMTCAAAALLATPAVASAETSLYDWPDSTAPVMIVSDGDILFLHRDGKPYRTYDWSPSGEEVHVADLDKNGGPEVLGVGRPTFAIATNADPMWFQKKGCKIGLVGDLIADEELELVCSDGRKVAVYTYDNQFAWSIDLGRRVKSCTLGDTNGDQKADIECKVGSRIVRIDSSGELVTAEAEDSLILTDEPPYEAYAAVGEEVITDKKMFDFDEDGTAEEYVEMEGTLLMVKSKAKGEPMAKIDIKVEPKGVLVKNIDGEGKPEVIIATDKEVIVMAPDGERKERFSLDASDYSRAPVADLKSVYANNFSDDDAAQKAIMDLKEDLAGCYASQVRKSEFAGSGQLLLEVKVDEKGKVSSVNTLHSEIADKSVVRCAEGKLKGAGLPAAAEGNTGSVNINMVYTFRAK